MRGSPHRNRNQFLVKLDAQLLALVEKYNQPGPRYTSYPTALQFAPEVDKRALLDAIGQETGPLSLYVHLPFCESLCWFCGCTTVITLNHSLADEYLDLLEKEIALLEPYLGSNRYAIQVHFGGGTPSFLSPAQIRRLGGILKRAFVIDQKTEFGVELDPRCLTHEHVAAFCELGMNRASMGVQDCNPEVQKAIHRIQPTELNVQALQWLREHGVTSVNIDLIYGLPKQTVDSFAQTLDEVIAYNPDRFAVFSYAHVPWMKPSQKILERTGLPSPDAKLAMLALITDKLSSAGYEYIGMDHFAKAKDELTVAQKAGTLQRNFQGYSTHGGAQIVALGMSAISQTAGTYRQNLKSLDAYRESILSGHPPIERGYLLTDEDLLRRSVIMQLMCNNRLNFGAFAAKCRGQNFAHHFEKELESLKPLEADGLIKLHPDSIEVTQWGRYLIRNIAMRFDAYFTGGPKRHARTI